MSRLPLATQRKILALREAEGLGRGAVAERLGVTEKEVRGVFEKHDGIPTGIIIPFRVYAWDLETTDFSSFIGSLGVAAFLDVATGKVRVKNQHDFGGSVAEREKALAEWTLSMFTSADALISNNGLGFDTAFLRGVLTRYELPPPPKRIHLDNMLIAQHGLKGRQGGSSMDNLADYFGLPIQKDKPSKHDWRLYIAGDREACERITIRCVEDVKVTAMLWEKLKPFYMTWRGQ